MRTAPQAHTTDPIPVVFCADVNVLDCLAVAVASVLGNASRPVRVHVFHDGMPAAAQQFLRETVRPLCRAGGETAFEQLDVSSFRGYASLHGNWMTYARLMLHSLLPDVARVIYLDADVVVCRDITELWDQAMDGKPIAGVAHCDKSQSIERDVWHALGVPLATPYYNAGVLVVDLDAWRAKDVTSALTNYFAAVDGLKTVVDQTALNAVFEGEWQDLPAEWNTACWPDSRLAAVSDPALLHYVGAPKPWDLGARWLHPESQRFFATARRCGVDLRQARALMPSAHRWRRALRLARSYTKVCVALARKR